MAIGRPIELTPNITSKNISVACTEGQTEFTVTGGYRINEIAVYRNGVRLVDGRDFSATDGNIVTFISDTVVADDIVEFSVFDSFDVAGVIVSAASTQTLGGNLHITGELYAGDFLPSNLNVSGIGTIGIGSFVDINVSGAATVAGTLIAGSFSGDGSALTNVGMDTANVVSTATTTTLLNVPGTTDSTSSTTGSVTIAGGVGIAKNVYIGAGLSVAGTLTYEDVTSVDSVGLITAKSGVNITGGELTVGSGITMGIAGVATFSGTSDVHLLDNVKLNVGDSNDFQVSHDGSDTILNNTTGALKILSDQTISFRDSGDSEAFAVFTDNGSVDLYYDNNKKFETTNDGTVTTGIATATGGLEINADSKSLKIGAGEDLTLQHDGTQSIINDTGNKLQIRSDLLQLMTASGKNEYYFQGAEDGAATIYHDNSAKLSTSATGVTITGNATATQFIGVSTGGTASGATVGVGTTSTILGVTDGATQNRFSGVLVEKASIQATNVTTGSIDIAQGNVHYFTTNGSGATAAAIKYKGGNNLSSYMKVGENISVSIISKPNNSEYISSVTIDGAAVTEEWLGGSVPSAASGAASSYTITSINITRIASTGTPNSDYLVLVSVLNYA